MGKACLWNIDPDLQLSCRIHYEGQGLMVPGMEVAMIHKFKVGQSVVPANPLRSSCNTYLVVKQLPLTSYEPQYWIQGVKNGVDCIVCESQIEAAEGHVPSLSFASLGALKTRAQSGTPS